MLPEKGRPAVLANDQTATSRRNPLLNKTLQSFYERLSKRTVFFHTCSTHFASRIPAAGNARFEGESNDTTDEDRC
jgi:hypothetical protein